VLTYDLYGRGQSDRARGLQDRAFFLRQLDELLADQKIDGAFLLLGYSMGGAIVTTFAARSPERVQRLVLVASAGLGEGLTGMGRFIARTPVIGDWLMQAMYPRMHRQGTEAERSLTTALEGTIDLQQQELKKRGFIPAVLSSLRGLLSENLHADHETIHKAGVPVLAIWGGDDTLIGEDAWNRLTHLNPKAQQQVVDGAGHGLPYTHADDVLAALNAPKG
jgi:pimeloyl-ACP methyl ester carboxylesterase